MLDLNPDLHLTFKPILHYLRLPIGADRYLAIYYIKAIDYKV